MKARLIPVIVARGNLVVQSFYFQNYLPIGDVKTAIEFFVQWDVDEIIILDITATKENRKPNFSLIEWAASDCFVPLTIGGGIRDITDIRDLLNAGADKVCINNQAIHSPDFIKESSSVFGSQCITVSVDSKLIDDEYYVYSYIDKSYKSPTREFVKEVENMGAGEIFLNSVDKDGSRAGYDIDLLKQVSSSLRIPVIACGGAGHVDHLPKAINEGGCQAVAAANLFQHTEHSTIAAKSRLARENVPIRLSSDVKYEDFNFDIMGRPF